ncbi:MAG: Ig-like domain-containing protein, partial [Planctomycetota bacterium]
MRARLLNFFAALVLVVAFVEPVLAKDCLTLVTPYDETFPRATGKPDESTTTFQVPTTAGSWWLTVENEGVTSAEVTLNGTRIFGPTDFARSVPVLRASVTVAASNTIEVRVASRPGTRVRIHVDGVVPDTAVPPSAVRHVFERTFFTRTFTGSSSAIVTVPTAGGLFFLDVTNGTPQGTGRASSAVVRLNGQSVFDANAFSQQPASLQAPITLGATNSLDVAVNAPAGASMVVTIRGYAVDTDAPALSIAEPQSGVWHRLAGDVRVTYSDGVAGIDVASFSASVNGVDVTSRFATTATTATASFAGLYPPFHEGTNDLVVSIADQACNRQSAQVQALIDSRPPSIIVSPGDGAATTKSPAFTAQLLDPLPGSGVAESTFRARLDGIDVTSQFSVSGGSASGAFAGLSEGQHSLVLSVADVAGNTAQVVTNFRVVSAPRVSVVPADGSATNDTLPTILVTHIADATTTIDLTSVELSLDGTPLTAVAQIASASAFLPDSPLAEGTHTLDIRVSDALGQTTVLNTTFKVELVATHFGITIAPADSRSVLVYSVNTLTIRALTASGEHAVAFTGPIRITTTDGLATLDQLVVDMTLADEGILRIPNLAIVRRTGPITVQAVALASPSITGTIGLVGVTSVPALSAPPVSAAGGAVITVQAQPGATVSIVVDGLIVATGTADQNGLATINVTIPPGRHRVQVHATNPDGTDGGWSVAIDLGPPVTVKGVVLGGDDAGETPLANVLVTLEGTSFGTTTDSAGRFQFGTIPVGDYVLRVNGMSVPGTYGSVRIGLNLSENRSLGAIVLRQIAGGAPIAFLDQVGTIAPTVVTNPALPGARVDVAGGTLLLPPAPVRPVLTVSRVSLVDVPIRVPQALATSLFVSIGPEGVQIPAGFKLTLPNVDNIPPGGTTSIWHYLPETNSWEIAGTAVVSADGQRLTLDPPQGGLYAAAATTAIRGYLFVDLFDAGDPAPRLTGLSPTELDISGTYLTTVDKTALQLGSVVLQFSVLPQPTPIGLRFTRHFSDDGSTTTVTRVVTLQPTFQVQRIGVRLGRSALVTGIVSVQDPLNSQNLLPVRGAEVVCRGQRAFSDGRGIYILPACPVWDPDPAMPGFVQVSGNKFVGVQFSGSVPRPLSVGQTVYTIPVLLVGAFQTGPHFLVNTVASVQGTESTNWLESLIYYRFTGRFYTTDVQGGRVLEINPSNGSSRRIAESLGLAGLQPNALALAGLAPSAETIPPDPPLSPAPPGLWVVDGRVGKALVIGADLSTGQGFVDNSPIFLVADNLNPLGPNT